MSLSADAVVDKVPDVMSRQVVPTRPAARRRRAAGIRNGAVPYAFIGPKLFLFVAFMMIPLVWTISNAFQAGELLGSQHFVGFGNFSQALKDPQFQTALEELLLLRDLRDPYHDLHRNVLGRALEPQDPISPAVRSPADHPRRHINGSCVGHLGLPDDDGWRTLQHYPRPSRCRAR